MKRKIKTKLKRKLTKLEIVNQVNFTLHGMLNNLIGQKTKLGVILPITARRLEQIEELLEETLVILKQEKKGRLKDGEGS